MCVCMISCSVVSDSVTLWTVAYHVPLAMEFPRKECWNGLPFPSPGDYPDPESKPLSPASPALQENSLPQSLGEAPQFRYRSGNFLFNYPQS